MGLHLRFKNVTASDGRREVEEMKMKRRSTKTNEHFKTCTPAP